MSTAPTELLFSYGTLQYTRVQIAHFGRELTGREAALPGYTRRVAPVRDPKVASLIGESQYANVEPGSREDAVPGIVFEVTAQELAAADKYEAAAGYHRISAMLESGDQAWVYIRK